MLIGFWPHLEGKGYASGKQRIPTHRFGDKHPQQLEASQASKVSVEQLANANKQATNLMAKRLE